MRFLLDTHVWLWWITEPERLPDAMAEAIESPTGRPLFSVASSWEIAVKYAIGKLPLPESPETFVPARLKRDEIETLPIEHRHALHVAALPAHHGDPFDRLLIAQAMLENLPIATVDPRFRAYEVRLLLPGSSW